MVGWAKGANHFTFTDPFETTTGRPFLDFTTTQPVEETRSFIGEMICLFIDAHVKNKAKAKTILHQYLDTKHPLIAEMKCK